MICPLLAFTGVRAHQDGSELGQRESCENGLNECQIENKLKLTKSPSTLGSDGSL